MQSIEIKVKFELPEGEFKNGNYTVTFEDGTVWKPAFVFSIADILPAILWMKPSNLGDFIKAVESRGTDALNAWHQLYMEEHNKRRKSRSSVMDTITVDDLMGD